MTCYVDDMRAKFGKMVMVHLIADTDDELHAMADTIGVDRRWWQRPPKASHSHYDIALSKRRLAIVAGAREITWRHLAAMVRRRQITNSPTLGDPSTAMAWYEEHIGTPAAPRPGQQLLFD